MSRDFDKAQEMVRASMEYVKILGCRIRRTEVQRDDWKLVAQSHADELIKLRQRVDELKAERDALKKERDDLWQREGIEQKRRIDVEQERDALRAQLETERKPNPVNVPRAHPVKVGEYVKNDNGDVCQVHEVYAEYLLNTGWTWAFENCTPCDPPPEASHITPEGKRTAEGAVTPQPGDVVILVRFPTPKECREWSDEFGKIGELATVVSDDDEPCPFCVSVVRSEGCMNWPLSCVEVVNGVDK